MGSPHQKMSKCEEWGQDCWFAPLGQWRCASHRHEPSWGAEAVPHEDVSVSLWNGVQEVLWKALGLHQSKV